MISYRKLILSDILKALTIAALLSGASFESAQAQTKQKLSRQQESTWKFRTYVDKMIDQRKCALDGPDNGEDAMGLSFQGDSTKSTLYFISTIGFSFDETHLITLRLDNSPARNILLRTIKTQYMAMDQGKEFKEIVNGFLHGQKISYRVSTLRGIEEGAFSLDKFQQQYETYTACLQL